MICMSFALALSVATASRRRAWVSRCGCRPFPFLRRERTPHDAPRRVVNNVAVTLEEAAAKGRGPTPIHQASDVPRDPEVVEWLADYSALEGPRPPRFARLSATGGRSTTTVREGDLSELSAGRA